MKNIRRTTKSRQSGFSLIELMIVVVVLVAVFGVVLAGLMQLQRRNSAEVSKMDITQEGREFIDQIVRDLRQAGYPRADMYSPALDPTVSAKVARTFNAMPTASQMQFEGDTDGTGTVNVVTVQVVTTGTTTVGGACPCTLQRGSIAKSLALGGATPTFYTEVNNVTTNAPFSYYTATGSAATTVQAIKYVNIAVTIQSPNADLTDKVAPAVALTSQAKINN